MSRSQIIGSFEVFGYVIDRAEISSEKTGPRAPMNINYQRVLLTTRRLAYY